MSGIKITDDIRKLAACVGRDLDHMPMDVLADVRAREFSTLALAEAIDAGYVTMITPDAHAQLARLAVFTRRTWHVSQAWHDGVAPAHVIAERMSVLAESCEIESRAALRAAREGVDTFNAPAAQRTIARRFVKGAQAQLRAARNWAENYTATV